MRVLHVERIMLFVTLCLIYAAIAMRDRSKRNRNKIYLIFYPFYVIPYANYIREKALHVQKYLIVNYKIYDIRCICMSDLC